MKAVCYPSVLSGTVDAIPSKSDAHRKLICAALSREGGTLPLRGKICDDIAATVRCLKALGSEITEVPDGLWVPPVKNVSAAILDCGESGSTLRFLLPIAMTVCEQVSVTGAGRLPDRPIRTLIEEMSSHGVQFSADKLPFHMKNKMKGGLYEIPGNISSQFLTGLLFALPMCSEDSEIRLLTSLQSSAYVDMTLQSLRDFGAEIDVSEWDGFPVYYVKGSQVLHFPDSVDIEGDWSNAAFWLTAGAVSPDTVISVLGLNADSTQGDRAIAQILSDSGAQITFDGDSVSSGSSFTHKFDVSMEEIPDLLPILAVRAAVGEGVSRFTNAGRLRLKESDRLSSVAELIRSLGGTAEESEDVLSVSGGQLQGGTVDAKNDHRLVMSAAIAATCCKNPVEILGAEAVNKSYPAFFDDYQKLGGKVEIIQ